MRFNPKTFTRVAFRGQGVDIMADVEVELGNLTRGAGGHGAFARFDMAPMEERFQLHLDEVHLAPEALADEDPVAEELGHLVAERYSEGFATYLARIGGLVSAGLLLAADEELARSPRDDMVDAFRFAMDSWQPLHRWRAGEHMEAYTAPEALVDDDPDHGQLPDRMAALRDYVLGALESRDPALTLPIMWPSLVRPRDFYLGLDLNGYWQPATLPPGPYSMESKVAGLKADRVIIDDPLGPGDQVDADAAAAWVESRLTERMKAAARWAADDAADEELADQAARAADQATEDQAAEIARDKGGDSKNPPGVT